MCENIKRTAYDFFVEFLSHTKGHPRKLHGEINVLIRPSGTSYLGPIRDRVKLF